MILSRRRLSATAVGAIVAILAAAVAAAGASATGRQTQRPLRWTACGARFRCARISVPRDYANTRGARLSLRVARLPARSKAPVGAIFVNFGGPGDPAAESLRGVGAGPFRALNGRYDIVAMDPRGTAGTGAIDCRINPERFGQIAQPLPRPATVTRRALVANFNTYIRRCVALNRRILPYVSTANAARDMDRVRLALRLPAINYLGFSYGTFLGTTYEALFPGQVGRFVLDGAIDPDSYLEQPIQSERDQTRAFETALGRFFQACAANQRACGGFGGDDPRARFDALVATMNANPLPARGRDRRAADGDDLLVGASAVLYAKQAWPILAAALAQAAHGDGTVVRRLADAFYGRLDNGTYDPTNDRFFAISALEARLPRGVGRYLELGANDFHLFPHFWWNSGYYELAEALWPIRPRGAYYGPYAAPPAAPPTLVIGNTYDPATPYADAQRLTVKLGNARLLTMRGDGHTAYLGGNSRCIDRAVEAYFNLGVVPAVGRTCRQQVPFRRLPAGAAAARAGRGLSPLLGSVGLRARPHR